MPTVQETIPEPLRTDVETALAWFNGQQDVAFEATGIVDPEVSLAKDDPRELRLVLCGGDRCEQRSFRVTNGAAGRQVAFAEAQAPQPGEPTPELDPPPGALRGWLDRALERHRFVVVLFYRGYW